MTSEEAEKYVLFFFENTKNSDAFLLTKEFEEARNLLGHERMQELYNKVNK